jgi:hypothetical protein
VPVADNDPATTMAGGLAQACRRRKTGEMVGAIAAAEPQHF